MPPPAHRPAPSTSAETRGRAAGTALYEGLATVPDDTISAHNSAQQLLG
ncbi:hypothetical protein [Streptomyces ossamyceticus]|nr:hypothetical protein [Streptomyces ossamyceticus]